MNEIPPRLPEGDWEGWVWSKRERLDPRVHFREDRDHEIGSIGDCLTVAFLRDEVWYNGIKRK